MIPCAFPMCHCPDGFCKFQSEEDRNRMLKLQQQEADAAKKPRQPWVPKQTAWFFGD